MGRDPNADVPIRDGEPGIVTAPDEQTAGAGSDLKHRADSAQVAANFDEAERLWREALAINGKDSDALCGIAYCLLTSGRIDEASPYIQRLIASPIIQDVPRIRLGNKLNDLHRHEDAVAVFRSVTAGFPNKAGFWNHLGAAELGAGRPAAALASLRRASRLEPTSAAIWCNLSLALIALDRLPEALAATRRALALEPASSVAAFNGSVVSLAMGRLDEGFAAYEHRFGLGGRSWLRGDVIAPPWTGEPIDGRSILVVGEQANGDQIQFARYVPELCRRGARVTYAAPTRLHRIFRSLHDDVTLVETAETGSRFDFQVPLMSLPRYCRAGDDRVIAATPYLRAEAERVASWRDRVGDRGFRVAVAWEGSRYAGSKDLNRSFPIEALWPLAQIPGVRLISLQMKDGLDQLARLPPGMAIETLGDDYDTGEHAFLDAAAVMMNADLVVTLDSALAHLAGALARPTWLALPFAPEWRWQRGRIDTPWYPTMRLFRQGVLGDWDGVFHRMAEALAPAVAAIRRSAEPQPTPAAPRPDPAPALPLVPASCGEVLDKISILEIKVERLQPAAAAAAGFELHHLREALKGFGVPDDRVHAQFEDLRRVNRSLWDVEDRLRDHEAKQRFDESFVALARSVYALNDERAAIKRRINVGLNSAIVEQKSYGEAAAAAES